MTRLERFVIGWPWYSAMIAEAYAVTCSKDNKMHEPKLKENDFNAYHGGYTTDANTTLLVDTKQFEHNTRPWEDSNGKSTPPSVFD